MLKLRSLVRHKDKQSSSTKLQLLPVKNMVKALEKGTPVAEPVISTLETLEELLLLTVNKGWQTLISLCKSLAQVKNAGTFTP